MAAERVVRVLPDVAAVPRSFDYLVPASLDGRVRVGSEVRVVLNGRRVGGWVVEDQVSPSEDVELRRIESVRGWGPPRALISLSHWAAWRWAGPPSAFLRAASSPRVVAVLPPPPGAHRGRLTSAAAWHGTRPAQAGLEVLRHPPAADLLPLAREVCGALGTGSEALEPPPQGEPPGVLILLPERAAACEMARRLRSEGEPVALLPEDWAAARAGGCVVVGTRSAAFAPLTRLAAAVVFDAHDESYKEQRAPTWNAWEVVSERARRDGARCIVVSPCPTLEMLEAGRLLVPPRAVEREGWPAVEVVDRSDDDPRKGLFSDRVVWWVRWATELPGRRVLCVLNRKGRVRLMACATCGEIARCEECSGPVELVSEQEGDTLRCRRCGVRRPVVCTRCGATRTRTLRAGVSRVREELEALAGGPVEEVWGPPGGGSAVASAPGSGAAVAVGTEAVLHRYRSADTVVFLDFDSELLAPRMRAGEQALALLARAARIVSASSAHPSTAGSTRAGGRVLVQTRIPGHEVLGAALSAEPGRLADSEREVRRALDLPPFSALAAISGAGAEEYGLSLRRGAPDGVEVSGPSEGVWSVRARGHEQLCDLLAATARPRARLRVEVDPLRA